jgi:hypothetical protein
MTKFIPVLYMGKPYPVGIRCPIEEVAGHLDKTSIRPSGRYSLHTEYSYFARDLDSALLQAFPTLGSSHIRSIPQLWRSEAWADEFAAFAVQLVGTHPPPDILEIHPPFLDYCPDIPTFLSRFIRFEAAIYRAFPATRICLENRAGTQYRKSGFLISSFDSVAALLQNLKEEGAALRLVLDYPQLFTAEGYDMNRFPIETFVEHQTRLAPYKDMISGIHIWGRKGLLGAHAGTLDDLFQGNTSMKKRVVEAIVSFYDDGRERYFVPEVNGSAKDLQAIVQDFLDCGVKFE